MLDMMELPLLPGPYEAGIDPPEESKKKIAEFYEQKLIPEINSCYGNSFTIYCNPAIAMYVKRDLKAQGWHVQTLNYNEYRISKKSTWRINFPWFLLGAGLVIPIIVSSLACGSAWIFLFGILALIAFTCGDQSFKDLKKHYEDSEK